jgi:hypothetical protein
LVDILHRNHPLPCECYLLEWDRRQIHQLSGVVDFQLYHRTIPADQAVRAPGKSLHGNLSEEAHESPWGVVMLSALGLAAIWYLNREILERLRFMRTKELNLAFDGFFIICRRHNLEIR